MSNIRGRASITLDQLDSRPAGTREGRYSAETRLRARLTRQEWQGGRRAMRVRDRPSSLGLRFHPEVQPHSSQRTCSEPDMTAAKQSRENERGGVWKGRKKGEGDQQDDTAHPISIFLWLARLLCFPSHPSHLIWSVHLHPLRHCFLSLRTKYASLSRRMWTYVAPVPVILPNFCLVLE